MLRAYFDESGIHAGSPVCVVAGLIASPSLCKDLELAWRHHLRQFDLPYFHAKDFAKGNSPYRHWGAARRREFLSASGDITEAWWRSTTRIPDIALFASAMDTAPFVSLPLNQRRWLTGGEVTESGKWKRQGAPTKPYFVPFQQIVLDAIRLTPQHHRIHFVLDRQNDYEHNATFIFDRLSEKYSPVRARLGDIVYSSKEQAVLLQIADFVAYSCYRFLTHEDNDGSGRAMWTYLLSNWHTTRIDKSGLQWLMRTRPIVPGKVFIIPPKGPFDVR